MAPSRRFIPCVQGLSMGYACSRVYLDEYPRKETTFNCVDELNPQLGTSKAACCETGASARLRRLKIDLSGAVQTEHRNPLHCGIIGRVRKSVM